MIVGEALSRMIDVASGAGLISSFLPWVAFFSRKSFKSQWNPVMEIGGKEVVSLESEGPLLRGQVYLNLVCIDEPS